MLRAGSVRLWAAVGLAAMSVIVLSGAAARSAQAFKGPCPPYGGVSAVIDGQPTCLSVGLRCKHRFDAVYRRYGFACPRWGLTIASRWRIHDLGTLPGYPGGSLATGINERGEVVGVSQAAHTYSQRVFLWKAGRMQDITAVDYGENAYAWINDSGQVLERLTLPPNAVRHSYVWQDGIVTDLGSLGGRETVGVAINARGQVTGWSTTSTGAQHAFVWQAGTMRDLGTLGGATVEPIAINANGEIVGRSDTANRVEHVFLWRDGVMRDLGTLDGAATSTSYATAINDDGMIVGVSHPESPGAYVNHAVRWRNGVISEIDPGRPVLGVGGLNNRGQAIVLVEGSDGFQHTLVWDDASGASRDIGYHHFGGDVLNDRGQVIFNTKDRPIGGLEQPFIFEQGRTWILGNLGQRDAYAADLNEHDQIVGYGFTHLHEHAVIGTR
jgi:probable HAF family extracellular repeat protein